MKTHGLAERSNTSNPKKKAADIRPLKTRVKKAFSKDAMTQLLTLENLCIVSGRVKEAITIKNAIILFMFAATFYFIFQFRHTAAMTFPEPIGIIYFVDEPSDATMQHETYHLEVQYEEEGWGLLTRYILGDGCIIEAEAGDAPDEHDVCQIPWMRDPEPEDIKTDEEIASWYHNFITEQKQTAAKP